MIEGRNIQTFGKSETKQDCCSAKHVGRELNDFRKIGWGRTIEGLTYHAEECRLNPKGNEKF